MSVFNYPLVVLALDIVRNVRKRICGNNGKLKFFKWHFFLHEFLQKSCEFYLVFQTQLLNLDDTMKLFLGVLNASIQEALNLLPLRVFLTEEELIGSGKVFVKIFVNRNDSHEMFLCLKIHDIAGSINNPAEDFIRVVDWLIGDHNWNIVLGTPNILHHQ